MQCTAVTSVRLPIFEECVFVQGPSLSVNVDIIIISREERRAEPGTRHSSDWARSALRTAKALKERRGEERKGEIDPGNSCGQKQWLRNWKTRHWTILDDTSDVRVLFQGCVHHRLLQPGARWAAIGVRGESTRRGVRWPTRTCIIAAM